MMNEKRKTIQPRYPWWDKPVATALKVAMYLLPLKTRRTRVVVISRRKVLLVLNRFDVEGRQWALPGGGCKRKETTANCAQRELSEELGINVAAGKLKKITTYRGRTGLCRSNYDIFLARVDHYDFTADNKELLGAGWFELENLPPNLNQLAAEALANLS